MSCNACSNVEIPEGIIRVGTINGDSLGFTAALFMEDSYLWKKEGSIYVSLIESREKGTGALRSLFETLESKGFTIKVPTPFPRMLQILQKQGFTRTFEEFQPGDLGEVWIKAPGSQKEKDVKKP